MGYFLVIVVALVTNCDPGDLSSTDNPSIHFTKLSSSTLQKPDAALTQHTTVLANKKMCIHFQDMNITRGWCYNYYEYNKNFDQEELPTMKSPKCFNNVIYNMSTLWKCNITEDERGKLEKPKYQAFYLNLHVKGAKTVQVTVNDKELMFSEADLSVPYDGDTIYFYEDGEHVQIICKNSQKTGTVHLEYLTKDVTKGNMNSTTFGIQLNSGSNNSYIDCVYNDTDRYVYRVKFVTSNQDKDDEYSWLILGTSIGAVLAILGLAVIVYWYLRARIQHIQFQAPYISHHSESTAQQIEWENQYNACYDTPDNIDDVDPKYHFYNEIDYLKCKPKIDKTQNRNSQVYDEPYVQMTISE